MKPINLILIITGASLLSIGLITLTQNKDGVSPKVVSAFQQWSQVNGRSYGSPTEKDFRLKVFSKNFKKVEQQNTKPGATWTAELNHFADLTEEEFTAKYLGYEAQTTETGLGTPFKSSRSETNPLPETIDWRKEGATTPVKDQARCGSCWAFAATGAMETAYFLQYGELVNLSEQQLIDCSKRYGNHGCSGGLPDFAFKYVKDHGLVTEDEYPYAAKDQRCKTQQTVDPAIQLKGFKDIASQKYEDLLEAVGEGSVAIGVHAQNFMMYKSGIFRDDKCAQQGLNHGIVLVGYGEENGEKYWIIRNSWGTKWGEAGYGRFYRDDHDGPQTCGLDLAASMPIVA